MNTPSSERLRQAARLSEILTAIMPKGIKPQAKPPYEQTDECISDLRKRRESRLRKAGLFGVYAQADSARGREVYELVKQGKGAYLWGLPGRGKTYAAATAVRLAFDDGLKVKMTTAKSLLDTIKEGFDGKDKETLRRAEKFDLLVIDDLGAERPTDWAIEQLSGLIDKRVINERPTIYTSNYRIGELRDFWSGKPGARVASRLSKCAAIEFVGDDWRLA